MHARGHHNVIYESAPVHATLAQPAAGAEGGNSVSAAGQALWIPLHLNGTAQYPDRKDLVIVPNVWEFMTQGTEAGQMLGQEIAAKWMTMKFLFDYTPMAAIAYPIELQLIYGFLRASKIYIYKYGCS